MGESQLSIEGEVGEVSFSWLVDFLFVVTALSAPVAKPCGGVFVLLVELGLFEMKCVVGAGGQSQ